jgi:hypothetical protein
MTINSNVGLSEEFVLKGVFLDERQAADPYVPNVAVGAPSATEDLGDGHKRKPAAKSVVARPVRR